MKSRLCYISHRDLDLPNFQQVMPNQISSLINSSVDRIHIDNINLYEYNTGSKIILQSIDKLKPQGLLSIEIYNIKHLCKNYIDGIIDDHKLTIYLSKTQYIYSISSIDNIIKASNMQIYQINYSDDRLTMNIVYQRK